MKKARLAVTAMLVFAGYSCKTSTAKLEDAEATEFTPKDQGNFGYCGKYATTSFFEAWNKIVNGPASPAIDHAFLTYGQNHLSGCGPSSWMHEDIITVATHGLIPMGAKPADGSFQWPPRDWEETHFSQDITQIGRAPIGSIFEARYTHPSLKTSFTPKEYVIDILKFDFSKWRILEQNTGEALSPVESKKQFRHGSKEEMDAAIIPLGSRLQVDSTYYVREFEPLYRVIVAQVTKGIPVMTGIRTGLTRSLASTQVLKSEDLVEVGTGTKGSHRIVVVAHCDRLGRSEAPRCKKFDAAPDLGATKECLIFQNTWGKSYHLDGDICIEKEALRRLLISAYVLTELDQR
jgi:hypothetical protein